MSDAPRDPTACRECHSYPRRYAMLHPCVACWPSMWYRQPRAADDPTPEEVEDKARAEGLVGAPCKPAQPQRHACAFLEYESRYLELVHPGTEYQRWALMAEPQPSKPEVRLQVVFFCPYCGLDLRADCHWRIPGRPQENEILNGARKAGEAANKKCSV